MIQFITILGLACLCLSCRLKDTDMTMKLHNLFDEDWEYRLKESPEFATYLGDGRYNDRLSNRSLEATEKRHQHALKNLEVLATIDRSSLGEEDQLNYDLFKKVMELKTEGYQYHGFLMPVNQMNGLQIDFPNLVNVTPFRNAKDYENYLERIAAFPGYVDQTIVLMKQGMEEGIVQPEIVLRTVPEQIRAQIDVDVEKSPFYEPFLSMPEEMPDSAKEHYRQRGITSIKENIIASYQKFYDFFVGEYLPSARKKIGAMHLPNGSDYYRYLVRYYTTTDLTPEQIHEIGLKEVERIREEMAKIIQEVNFDGTFHEFVEFLRTDPQFYYSSAEELLSGYRDICKRADPALTMLFGRLPRIPYGVIPIPGYQAPAAPTAYYHPAAADGSRPGYFWANTYRLDTRPKYEMEVLALHEAVPGHHLQITLSQEMEDLPKFRRHGGFSAFVEGWGLYAESLGEEMGFYEDPYSKFGQLTYEMWRACRLVVDTGMHELGWSRQQAIDFLKENTAKAEHDIVVEIDRYIVWPGQALAYKIGELKIKELRTMAEEALGADFDIREFHDVVLSGGALPLDILEKRIQIYVDKKKH